jgi:hypothetical protein
MPTVPSNFVPQVQLADGGQVPYQAPGVQPMENMAARQAVEMGARVTELGGVAYASGSQMLSDLQRAERMRQDALDESRAKELETQFLTSATQTLSKSGGYLGTVGKDAETRYAETESALSDAMQSALGGAQNDVQRKMLAPALARHSLGFTMKAAEHRDGQVRVYYGNEAKARAGQFASLAVDEYKTRGQDGADGRVGAFHANVIVAIDEVHKFGATLGIPEGSAQMHALEQAVYGQVATGVAVRLAADRDYEGAIDFVKSQAKKTNIDSATADKLLADLQADRKRQTVSELVDSIRATGTLSAPSSPDEALRTSQVADANALAGKSPSLRDQLLVAGKIEDPDVRKAVAANLRQDFAQDEALKANEYRSVLDAVDNQIAAGTNPRDLPLMLWMKLKPTDQKRFVEGQRQEDDVGSREELARNPGLLTQEWLDANRPKLTRETYIRLQSAVNEPKEQREQKIYDATVDADTVSLRLMELGYPDLARPNTAAEKDSALRIRERIKIGIDARQRYLERKLTDPEKRELIDGMIKPIRQLDEYGIDKKIPMLAVPESDLAAATYFDTATSEYRLQIDSDMRKLIEDSFLAEGVKPTEARVGRAYIELLGLGRIPQR